MVVVGNGKQETAMKWSKTNQFPYQVILDYSLMFYRKLGMKKSAMIWQASNFWGFAEDFLAGKQMPSIIEGEGIHVMGGDFIADSSGKLVFAHGMKIGIPKDRPTLDMIFATLDPLVEP